jgi:hypothetical protein
LPKPESAKTSLSRAVRISSQESIVFLLRSSNYAECSQQSGVDVKAIERKGDVTKSV